MASDGALHFVGGERTAEVAVEQRSHGEDDSEGSSKVAYLLVGTMEWKELMVEEERTLVGKEHEDPVPQEAP